jgi:hypothetical protein
LFADLSGFTTVSERSDPELIRDFQTDLFRELARIPPTPPRSTGPCARVATCSNRVVACPSWRAP